MMDFKKFIWDLFPLYFYKYDTYKDHEGKGVLQRYVKTFGAEIDEEVITYLDESHENYYLNNIEALKIKEKLIPIIQYLLGSPPSILEGEDYRKILQYIVPIYTIKGTRLSYKLFINLLGFEVEIIEHEPGEFVGEIGEQLLTYDFDPELFYDEGNLYDSNIGETETLCVYCSDYTLLLKSLGPSLTEEVIDKIKEIIVFIEPINAVLREILLAIDKFEDTLEICFKQDVRIKVLIIPNYDLGLLYDETLLYDSDTEMSQTIISIDCEGNPQGEGIGYWDIEGTNVIE